MNIGNKVKGSIKIAIHVDVHRFTRDSVFETMLNAIRSPLRNEIRIPVRDSVPNPINIII